MNEFLNNYLALVEQSSVAQLVCFAVFFFTVYFLPTLLAVFFNRQHLAKIAVLNIPAGFSLIVWGALVLWACTGKVGQVLVKKLGESRNASA